MEPNHLLGTLTLQGACVLEILGVLQKVRELSRLPEAPTALLVEGMREQ